MTHVTNFKKAVKEELKFQLDTMQLLKYYSNDLFEKFYKKHTQDIKNIIPLAGNIFDDIIKSATPQPIQD